MDIMKKVLALTGMPGSGKSTASETLAGLGLPVVSMGNAVRSEMRKQGIEINDSNLRDFAAKSREKYGPDYVIKLVSSELENAFVSSDSVVLDGARNIAEIDFLKKANYNVYLAAIVADKSTRYDRMLKRHNKSDSDSVEGLVARDAKELGFGVSELIALSDYYIVNNYDGVEEFKNSLVSLCKKLDIV